MFKLFFYYIFKKSKTLKHLLNINIQSKERSINVLNENKNKALLERIKTVLEINQNRSLRRKWNRITNNKNSPFYIYK